MTYNWNTMVEITVPTGTNGWLYSGEVIINGVKVRFPVGVPTSVPEPAAVLLKKMIELEQEEDANTAKPQNHYVGDVTIPAGKTLTLEKGAKFVDNSGPSEVVILPETEYPGGGMDTQIPITTPLSAMPTPGATAIVTWNGTEYACQIARQTESGNDGYLMGNFEAMGAPYGGSNPDAPFVVALVPAGMGGMYGIIMPVEEVASITLSIVQVGAAGGGSAGGGVVTATAVIGDGPSVTSIDKTYSELLSAVKAGKYVQMMAKIGTSITAMPFVFWMEESDSGYMLFSVEAKTIAATLQYNADGTAEWG